MKACDDKRCECGSPLLLSNAYKFKSVGVTFNPIQAGISKTRSGREGGAESEPPSLLRSPSSELNQILYEQIQYYESASAKFQVF